MFLFSISHFVQSLIKKGMPLGPGLSPLTENDETEDFSQPDLSQVTGATSQVTAILSTDPTLNYSRFFLKCEIYIK